MKSRPQLHFQPSVFVSHTSAKAPSNESRNMSFTRATAESLPVQTLSSLRRRSISSGENNWAALQRGSCTFCKTPMMNYCSGKCARQTVAAMLILSSNHKLSFNGCEKVEAISQESILMTIAFLLFIFLPKILMSI